jgi:hypothetical protein
MSVPCVQQAPKKIAACSILIWINTPNTYNKNILLSLSRKNIKTFLNVHYENFWSEVHHHSSLALNLRSHVLFELDEVALWQVFSRVVPFPLPIHIPPIAPQSPSIIWGLSK